MKHWVQRRRAVRDQWCAHLPEEKNRLFDSLVEPLEASYTMGSVALDEAFGLRAQAALIHAREGTAVAADLFERLAEALLAALGALAEHGRHLGDLPDVLPLNADFFLGEFARRIAARNSLLHLVLLSARSRFFHKVHALDDAVEGLAREFCWTADEIAEGTSVRPESHWAALDTVHYDLNTCLRETIVLLKSFLYCLPDDQVGPFERQLAAQREVVRKSCQTLIGRRARARTSRAST